MEKITFFGESDGISVQQMIRYGEYNMKAKHFHNKYEIFYIVEGERQFFFNNRQYLAHSGDLILIDSNLIHMTRSLNAEDTGHNRIILYVSQEKMEQFDDLYPQLRLVHFLHENCGVYPLNPAQQQQFLSLYHDLQTMMTGKPDHYETGVDLRVLSWLFQMTSELKDGEANLPAQIDSPKCRMAYAVADYLSKNCEQNITLDELAQRFYLSKYYLCRSFKEVTNYTITEYINIHRIQKAKHLLESSGLSINEIALKLGYDSSTYFERMFKNYMKIPPLRYRKLHQKVIASKKDFSTLTPTEILGNI